MAKAPIVKKPSDTTIEELNTMIETGIFYDQTSPYHYLRVQTLQNQLILLKLTELCELLSRKNRG